MQWTLTLKNGWRHLTGFEREIRWRVVHRGDILNNVSRFLQKMFPEITGLSVGSVMQFCSSRGIHYRSNLGDCELDEVVRLRVLNIGHSCTSRRVACWGDSCKSATFGNVSKTHIYTSTLCKDPDAWETDESNTLLHWVFGEKLHFDQNEKLVMYGAVHAVAIDGYSWNFVGFCTMRRKNAITIFGAIFQPLLLQRGIWNQVRSDHGTEFSLVATVQHYLAHHRVNQLRLPVLQTTSRQNHRAERIWLEFNSHINYPI